jgi:hypothetical protein
MSVTYSKRRTIAMLLLAVSFLVNPALAGASAPVAHSSSDGSDDHGGSGVKSEDYLNSTLRIFSSKPREG